MPQSIVEFEETSWTKIYQGFMGIYIFDWARLRNMLVAVEKSDVDMSDSVKMFQRI